MRTCSYRRIALGQLVWPGSRHSADSLSVLFVRPSVRTKRYATGLRLRAFWNTAVAGGSRTPHRPVRSRSTGCRPKLPAPLPHSILRP
jgi:hypothetical protein